MIATGQHDEKDFRLMIQTWLPLPNFRESAEALHDKDLGHQRWHALAVIEQLHQITPEESKMNDAYKNIPVNGSLEHCAAMWSGCEIQLCEYALEVTEEWCIRNHRQDPLLDVFYEHMEWATGEDSFMGKPSWFGDAEFHLSHQAALVRMNPDFYKGRFNADPNLKLLWPRHAAA